MVKGKLGPLRLKPAPVTVACEMVTLEPPVLVTRADPDWLAPTGTVPKTRVAEFGVSRPGWELVVGCFCERAWQPTKAMSISKIDAEAMPRHCQPRSFTGWPFVPHKPHGGDSSSPGLGSESQGGAKTVIILRFGSLDAQVTNGQMLR